MLLKPTVPVPYKNNMDLPREIKEKARGRQQFKHGDQVVYEWEQNLDEVLVYFKPPPWALPKHQAELRRNLQPGQRLPEMEVVIDRDHMKVGVKGNPPFLDADLGGSVIKADSLWMIEDDELVVNLQKMRKAQTWTEVFRGHQTLDPLTQNEVQKKILLERFQEENPGFDFSGAEFNGMVPDARTFMGGVSYK